MGESSTLFVDCRNFASVLVLSNTFGPPPSGAMSSTGSQDLWLAMRNHAIQAWDRLLQLIQPHRQALVGDRPRLLLNVGPLLSGTAA